MKKTKKKTDRAVWGTKVVKMLDRPMTDILPYYFDESFVDAGPLTRTGHRKFSQIIRLQKKTKLK